MFNRKNICESTTSKNILSYELTHNGKTLKNVICHKELKEIETKSFKLSKSVSEIMSSNNCSNEFQEVHCKPSRLPLNFKIEFNIEKPSLIHSVLFNFDKTESKPNSLNILNNAIKSIGIENIDINIISEKLNYANMHNLNQIEFLSDTVKYLLNRDPEFESISSLLIVNLRD